MEKLIFNFDLKAVNLHFSIVHLFIFFLLFSTETGKDGNTVEYAIFMIQDHNVLIQNYMHDYAMRFLAM